jgi:hypothetical protein
MWFRFYARLQAVLAQLRFDRGDLRFCFVLQTNYGNFLFMKLFILLIKLLSQVVDFAVPARVDQMRRLALPNRGGARPICESGQLIDVAEQLIGLDLYFNDGIGLGERERRRRRESH